MQRVTFAQLMDRMARAPEAITAGMRPGLTKCAVEVQKTAVSKFGTYQPASGPYEAWALLSIETVIRKMDYGGASGPNPLIGSYGPGDQNKVYPTPLRQSIQIHVADTYAEVGTNDPIGEWQEFGTQKGIPPRPFLRPALYENEEFIKKTLRNELGAALWEALR